QPEQYEAMGSALSNAYIGFRGLLPGDNLFTAECGCWLGLHRAAKRDFKEASAFLMEAHGILERLFGKASPVPIAVGISCARLLTEMGENYQRQKDLLETSIAFGEKNSTERRYVLWKERSMAYLAEAIYRSGDGAEADRIFGIVETHIANQPGSPDLASVKASCAQNRVRHLIVEKRFEEALVVIDEMADGSWPAPNKGLGAERLFRMRADLLRRVGREKDAQLDERIVRMIGDNVTELQAVSCAPIGRIERSPER
ncbi:MAG: hypothetical protein GYA33_12350, partial [Thermogutta sp.]|nr:hypothetical protein [Thermogutta sp.]